MVTEKSGQWPEKLEWGWIENRHIIRAFVNMGILYWKKNKTLEAYSLFQKLLETNPNDNAGVRYFMLAILEKCLKKSLTNGLIKVVIGIMKLMTGLMKRLRIIKKNLITG